MTTGAEASTPASRPAPQRRAWTPQAIRALGATTDVETAGEIIGIGRTKAYELAQRGEFPTKMLRVGRRYLVPVEAILKLLGLPPEASPPPRTDRTDRPDSKPDPPSAGPSPRLRISYEITYADASIHPELAASQAATVLDVLRWFAEREIE
jgi:hypothetical protein